MEPLLLTVLDAARAVSISRSALYELLADGAIRSVKHGRKRLVDAASLSAWAASLPESQLKPSAKGA
jgi:excisionase family DNA binding protein